MMPNLNEIKEAIEYDPYGKKYKQFFIGLENEYPKKNPTYSLLTTNRKGVNYLLGYYNIPGLDMEELYEQVTNDPDIRNTKSQLYIELTKITNSTWTKGEQNLNVVLKDLKKQPGIKEVKNVSGLYEKKDMFDKVDIEIIMKNEKKFNIQVKPKNEKITNSDRNSKAHILASVDGTDKVSYEWINN